MKFIFLHIEGKIKVEYHQFRDFVNFLYGARVHLINYNNSSEQTANDIALYYTLEKMIYRFSNMLVTRVYKEKKEFTVKFNHAELAVSSALFNQFKFPPQLASIDLQISNSLR